MQLFQCTNMIAGDTLISPVQYSPDGNFVAYGDWGTDVYIWDLQEGRRAKVFSTQLDPVLAICYSPDGRYLTAGCGFGDLCTWDARTGECLDFSTQLYNNPIEDLSYSPDGQSLAVASHKGVRIGGIKDGRCDPLTVCEQARGASVSYSPDGRFLVSGDSGNGIRILDATTGVTVKTLEGHINRVVIVRWSPDGKFIASTGWDYTLRLWDSETGVCVGRTKLQDIIADLRYSPDGKFLAVVLSCKKVALILDAGSLECVGTLEGHTRSIRAMSYSPDGKFIATGSQDKTIRIWAVRME